MRFPEIIHLKLISLLNNKDFWKVCLSKKLAKRRKTDLGMKLWLNVS
jgi:hypothetical protein